MVSPVSVERDGREEPFGMSVNAHRPTGRIPRSILEMAGKLMIVMILDFAERYVSAGLFDHLSRKTDGVAA
jgi:hypothetical protein